MSEALFECLGSLFTEIAVEPCQQFSIAGRKKVRVWIVLAVHALTFIFLRCG